MPNARYLLGLYGGKAARLGLRILKRNGSYMPGAISVRLDPMYMEHLPKPSKIIAVTGTNGKTTTSNMILDVLSESDKSVVNNSTGSNTDIGIISALARNVDFLGRRKSEKAVLEIDERWTPKIFKKIQPQMLVITNLYQDSIKRNAHTDFIRDTIDRGIPSGTKLILNGDDLISSQIGAQHERVFFSIAPLEDEEERRDSRLKDIRYCPECHTELVWDFVRYHHLGQAHCPECGFTNQKSKYRALSVDYDKKEILVDDNGTSVLMPLILRTTETIYNQMAAYSALRESGLSAAEITAAMKKMKVVSTRFNKTRAGGKNIYLLSAKRLNPIANSRAFDIVRKHPGRKTVIYLNDDDPGTRYKENLSWLYDADFHYLATEELNRFIINSWRGSDVAVRALMAGVPEAKLSILNDSKLVAGEVDYETEGDIFILSDISASNLNMAQAIKNDLVKNLEAKGIKAPLN